MPDSAPYDEHDQHSRPFQDVMSGVVNRLEAEAKERIGRRRLVDERWFAQPHAQAPRRLGQRHFLDQRNPPA